mmetsp:Transcript_97285/g.251667  ORF Transcript_97285/g.251667 Transcript_97285/m.251667 type:complete len:319 (+) Transcript_97285:5638-6594(+)
MEPPPPTASVTPPMASWYCCMDSGCNAVESYSPSSSLPSPLSSRSERMNSGWGCRFTYSVPSTAEEFLSETGAVAMAPSVSCPNSISSSTKSMLGTTAVAIIGSLMGFPPRTFKLRTVSSCIGLSSSTCTSMSARPSGATRPRMGETCTPSGMLSTWKTAHVLPLFCMGTERSDGRPTASTPRSSFCLLLLVTKLRNASGACPVHRRGWSLPSSVFSVKNVSIIAPLIGGAKTISHVHEPPGRITPEVGLMENDEFAPCHEKRDGALPELDSSTVSVRVRSRFSSPKRKLISVRDILIWTGVISALTSSLNAWIPLIW